MSSPLFQVTKQQEHCPRCQAILQIKQGKKGLFLGCSNYPACDYLKPLHQHESKVIKILPQNCPECAHELVLRQGSFGMFIGCSQYPICHFIVHDEPEQNNSNILCPECQQGQLVSRRGRQGRIFYACDSFPNCKFTLSQQPYLVSCPLCHGSVSIIRKQQDTNYTWQCVNKQCKHIFQTSD